MMKVSLLFLVIFAITATDGNEICKDTLKALIEARHEEFHRDFVSLKKEVKEDLRAMNKINQDIKTLKEKLQKIGTGNGIYFLIYFLVQL